MAVPAAAQGLMEANAGCARRWKLGGCVHCPTWAHVAELWKAAAEARRAGGFVALAPSADAEWTSYLPGGMGLAQGLLRAWVEQPEGASVAQRWDAMLCDGAADWVGN